MSQWDLIVDYDKHDGLETYRFDEKPVQTELAEGVVVYHGRVLGLNTMVFVAEEKTFGWVLEEVGERNREGR